jgi:hypothetical protein
MTLFRAFVVGIAVSALAVAPALAKGGGGNGGGNGGGAAAGGNVGSPASSHATGAGRGTAISAPGSQHRSSKATEQLSTPTPGKANPPSGVTPGMGKVGTVPTTPGQAP